MRLRELEHTEDKRRETELYILKAKNTAKLRKIGAGVASQAELSELGDESLLVEEQQGENVGPINNCGHGAQMQAFNEIALAMKEQTTLIKTFCDIPSY